jgi:flagellar hook-associated protein FlgK
LADVLNQANSLTPQLASVNSKIRAAAIPGLAAASPDLLDERDRIVGKLQELVGGTTLINEDASASFLLNGQHLVDREVANKFTNTAGTSVIRSDMPLSDLRIKVASLDGRNPVYVKLVLPSVAQKQSNGVTPLLDTNGNSVMVPGQTILQDGKAGAYVHLLQNFVPTVQKSINLLATQLVRSINQVTNAAGTAICKGCNVRV